MARLCKKLQTLPSNSTLPPVIVNSYTGDLDSHHGRVWIWPKSLIFMKLNCKLESSFLDRSPLFHSTPAGTRAGAEKGMHQTLSPSPPAQATHTPAPASQFQFVQCGCAYNLPNRDGEASRVVGDQFPRVPCQPKSRILTSLNASNPTTSRATAWSLGTLPKIPSKTSKLTTFAARLAMYVRLFRREAAAQHPNRLAGTKHRSLKANNAGTFSLRSPEALLSENIAIRGKTE